MEPLMWLMVLLLVYSIFSNILGIYLCGIEYVVKMKRSGAWLRMVLAFVWITVLMLVLTTV